jgi:phosphoglycolate phosphatase-like HAD superfamily hydrolase
MSIETPRTLVLFDIDGTLVDCGAASGRGFSRAFHEAFGVPCPIFPPEDVAGLTDGAILSEVVRRLGIQVEDFERRRALAFEVYARNLVTELTLQPARELPGAGQAVEAVRRMPGVATGLLTGSTQATARIKLESAGIDFGWFAFGAYSEDSDHREALPHAARTRFSDVYGLEPSRTILIGDTPRDVKAALAAGCAFIGVTTGHYDRASLVEAGAAVILGDLSNPTFLCSTIEELVDFPRTIS